MFAAITITGKITLFFHWVSPIHCILFNLMTLVLKSLNIKEHLTMDGETSLFSVIHLSLCLDYFALIRQGVLDDLPNHVYGVMEIVKILGVEGFVVLILHDVGGT